MVERCHNFDTVKLEKQCWSRLINVNNPYTVTNGEVTLAFSPLTARGNYWELLKTTNTGDKLRTTPSEPY